MPLTHNHSGRHQGRFDEGPQSALGSAAEDLGTQAGDLAEDAKDAAARLQSDVEETAAEKKTVVASLINDFADVIDAAARHLDERGQRTFARYADGMSATLTGFSQTVEKKSLGDIVGDVSDLARRHPAAFVGSALVAGIALSRIAKAAPSSVTQPIAERVKSAVSDVKSAVADVTADLASAATASNEGRK